MLYTIQNDQLSAVVNSKGAELWSIKTKDNLEYLWQGDPTYWADRSPNLFPYIGRMIDKKYFYSGKSYKMDIHGFALSMEFEAINHSTNELSLRLCSNSETKKQYPWNFEYDVTYKLVDSTLEVIFTVKNLDSTPMLFAVGGHPGFFVPLSEGESFEDYRLRFIGNSDPERVIFTEDCFVDSMEPYFLNSVNSIPLRHDLFDRDAIVLKNTGKTVVLENPKGPHSVTVNFPDMAYIGFWHEPKTDAPYVCIEPWSSLPSAKGAETIWENQPDLLTLEAYGSYQNRWAITIK